MDTLFLAIEGGTIGTLDKNGKGGYKQRKGLGINSGKGGVQIAEQAPH